MREEIREKKEEILEGFDFPKELIKNIPKITVIGDTEIIIENHKGIRRFDQDIIEINSTLGVLNISGEKFEIVYIGTDTVIVKGKFNSIYYKEKEQHGSK